MPAKTDLIGPLAVALYDGMDPVAELSRWENTDEESRALAIAFATSLLPLIVEFVAGWLEKAGDGETCDDECGWMCDAIAQAWQRDMQP